MIGVGLDKNIRDFFLEVFWPSGDTSFEFRKQVLAEDTNLFFFLHIDGI